MIRALYRCNGRNGVESRRMTDIRQVPCPRTGRQCPGRGIRSGGHLAPRGPHLIRSDRRREVSQSVSVRDGDFVPGVVVSSESSASKHILFSQPGMFGKFCCRDKLFFIGFSNIRQGFSRGIFLRPAAGEVWARGGYTTPQPRDHTSVSRRFFLEIERVGRPDNDPIVSWATTGATCWIR